MGNNGIWALEKHPMEFLYGYSVVADLRPGDKLFTTETFGPIIGVLPYRVAVLPGGLPLADGGIGIAGVSPALAHEIAKAVT